MLETNKDKKHSNDKSDGTWENAILSVLESSSRKTDDDINNHIKKVRKHVLLSLQYEENDKQAKKLFKSTIQSLENSGIIVLDTNGSITLSTTTKKRKKEKKEKKEKKKSKKQKRSDDNDNNNIGSATDHSTIATTTNNDDEDDGSTQMQAQHHRMESDSTKNTKKNQPCPGNPLGITRLFLGNLPFTVTEQAIEDFIPGVTHIKWITDKETGKFYGSAFIEMDTPVNASTAVTTKAGAMLLGRPIKMNYAPARPGEKWPPDKKVISGGAPTPTTKSNTTNSRITTGSSAGGVGVQGMSVKPEGCFKLFIGNLSYDIDDDAITKFFANVDAEVKAIRWIHHKDTGDFKGVGFVEFWNTEACDKAATLNGKNLLGRPIRIDWTD